MRRAKISLFLSAALSIAFFSIGANAEPPTAIALHSVVRGTDITTVELGDAARKTFQTVSWADLSHLHLAPGDVVVRFEVAGGDHVALEIPVCSGRGRVLVDGAATKSQGPSPIVLQLPSRPERAYEIEIEIAVGGYEHRVACGFAPRFGAETQTREGLSQISFSSPSASLGGGHAVVFVPSGHDRTKPSALLVGLHPWNGNIWTYAAYAELLHEAAARDVVLLMPSGLGNSLYTATAEDEVMRAIDALAQAVAIDPHRVSIWGASMGGAGATTIGFHRPDKFASVTSFFGDSKYDLATYVKSILPSEAAAHAVNALDVVENSRNLAVWLIHGEDDHVSPIAESVMLVRAMQDRGFPVQFDRVPRTGHEGALVAKFAAAVVDRAATTFQNPTPARVSFRSVRANDTSAYGVRIARAGGDAFVDLERRGETVHLLDARGVKSIELARGAFGIRSTPSIVKDGATTAVDVHWEKFEEPVSDSRAAHP